jgi:large subunit ribosomal protein L15
MIRLHNLRPRPGAKHRTKRLGIGESSGHGKTSGKGHKGQKARSGGSIRLGFEGGQMPLIRRLPKRGFNNAAFHKTYAVINLDDLNQFEAGTSINEQMLRESKLVRGKVAGLKILGRGELDRSLTIEADKVSESARAKIEKAGGKVNLKAPRAAHGPRHPAAEAQAEPPAPAPKAKKRATKKKPAK